MLKLKLFRAKALFTLKNKGAKIMQSKMPKLPKTWELFPDRDDRWCEVEYPHDQDISGALYHAISGSTFKGHTHNHHTELFTVINKGGVVRVYTKKYNRTLKFGDSVTFEKGEAHLVEFITETIINIIWQPKMESSLEIDYVNEDN